MFRKQSVTLQSTSIKNLCVCRCNRETMSESNRLLFVCLFCFLSVGCCCFCFIPNVSTSILTNTASLFYRGTQREYSSKPLKHSFVKRISVFKRQIQAYFYPRKTFFIFSDFLAESLVIRKLQGSKLTFSKISAGKKAPENSMSPFQGKNQLKKGNYSSFQLFENPRRGRLARNFTMKCSENSRSRIVFRTDISENCRWGLLILSPSSPLRVRYRW